MTEQSKDAHLIISGSQNTDKCRSGQSCKWVSKCGEPHSSKRAMHTHQKQCPKCQSMIHTGPTAAKERIMYCGVVVITRKKATEHYQACSICQQKSKEAQHGGIYTWVSKCGEKQLTKRALQAHQKQCSKCLSMIQSGPSSGKERTMYCGAVVRTKKKASEHYQNCQVCHAKRREIRIETCKKLEQGDHYKTSILGSDVSEERKQRIGPKEHSHKVKSPLNPKQDPNQSPY